MNKEWLKEMEKEGTPAYVFDLDVFRNRFSYLHNGIGTDTGLTFSMKANPFLTKAAAEIAEHIEVCSFGEFCLCRQLGIKQEKLLISGVLKKEDDTREMVSYGKEKALYTAESPDQMAILNQCAEQLGITIKVLPRLSSGSQFGMDADTVKSLIANRDKYPYLEIIGIHFFSGTQKKALKKHYKEIAMLDAFLLSVEAETGYHLQMLEYGTGFGVPYFVDQKETVTTPESLAEFKALLAGMKWQGHKSVEMGRALAYSCGSYFTAIDDLKTTDGDNYVICDGGIHQLHYDGQLRGMYIPDIDVISKYPSGMEETYAICGSLCTTNDILVSGFRHSKLHKGDILVFENTGAYSFYEGMSLFLSHELPVVWLADQNGLKLARGRRETWMLNGDGCATIAE
ncbi:MAG: alanine racemase [Lactimicrobium sp.]|jgi:diaminopimelate decarboxylase|uniref:alanine racemase n=1 Tax=Lactimicrobium sp. TaxID=2563780 RepID=UPI002F356EA5